MIIISGRTRVGNTTIGRERRRKYCVGFSTSRIQIVDEYIKIMIIKRIPECTKKIKLLLLILSFFYSLLYLILYYTVYLFIIKIRLLTQYQKNTCII